MEKIKILVACHKHASVPNDEVYTPIHVGKALHPEFDLGFIGDDTGDNISKKNASYCELTAQYWGWKNIKSEYLGLCHYRRFFETKFNANTIEQQMDGNDVILVNPIHFNCSVHDFWMSKLIPEDVTILYLIMQKYYLEDFGHFEKFVTGNLFYPYNMFVCKKDLFDEFAQWQFDILEKVERVLPLSSYSRERRIFGYIAEVLLPIYFISRGYKIKTMPIVDQIGKIAIPHWKTKVKIALQNWYKDRKFSHNRTYTLPLGDDYLQCLKQDGIIDAIDNLRNPNN